MNEEITKREDENKPRVCEKGLQMESCRQCLFETLCRLEKQEEQMRRHIEK